MIVNRIARNRFLEFLNLNFAQFYHETNLHFSLKDAFRCIVYNLKKNLRRWLVVLIVQESHVIAALTLFYYVSRKLFTIVTRLMTELGQL